MYYLNNTGSRWKTPGEKIMVDDGTKCRALAVEFWESCGNFARPIVRIRGKRESVVPHSDVRVSIYEIIVWRPWEVAVARRNLDFWKSHPYFRPFDWKEQQNNWIEKYPTLEAFSI